MADRQYSFSIEGQKWTSGEIKEVRRAHIVAMCAEKAIDEAKALLDPEGHFTQQQGGTDIYRWVAVAVDELTAQEAKVWARWHNETISMHQRQLQADKVA